MKEKKLEERSKHRMDGRARKVQFDQIKGTIAVLESLGETVLLAWIFYLVWRNAYSTSSAFYPYLGRGKIVLMIVYAVIMYLMLRLCDGLQFGNLRILDSTISQWVAALLANLLTYLQLSLMVNALTGFKPILLLTVIDFVVMICCTTLFSKLYRVFYVPKDMLMIYGSENAAALKDKMDRHQDRYHVNGMIQASVGYGRIREEISHHNAVLLNDIEAELRNDILKYCYQNRIQVYIVPKISDIVLRGASDVNVVDTPLVLVRGNGLSPGEAFLKRFFDIFLCILAMVIAAPMMLIIAMLIKLDDGGPVFYRQRRVTKDGREFDILKFRSMIVDAEKNGDVIPAEDGDPRITKVGKRIRATRMDEIPQILNILKGDMSIVGPRPERVEHVHMYTEQIPEFINRLKVKGGLTGYAQVYGKYNTTAYDKIRMDLMYIEDYSLLLDFKIIIMTLRILFKKESTEGFKKEKAE